MLNWIANIVLIVAGIFLLIAILAGALAEPKVAATVGVGMLVVWAAYYKYERVVTESQKKDRKKIASFGL